MEIDATVSTTPIASVAASLRTIRVTSILALHVWLLIFEDVLDRAW